MSASRPCISICRRKNLQSLLEVLLVAAIGCPFLSAQAGAHAAGSGSASLFGPPTGSASFAADEKPWSGSHAGTQTASWTAAEPSTDPLTAEPALQSESEQDTANSPVRQAPLFDAPGTPASGLSLSAHAAINPFSQGLSSKPARPAPLFLLRGALDPIPAALPSFQRLMHQMVALPGDGLRFARRQLLFANGPSAALPRPPADALFGTSSLGNGVALSAGASLGHHAAQKLPGPAVGLKLSF